MERRLRGFASLVLHLFEFRIHDIVASGTAAGARARLAAGVVGCGACLGSGTAGT